jgi:hypothetical protein
MLRLIITYKRPVYPRHLPLLIRAWTLTCTQPAGVCWVAPIRRLRIYYTMSNCRRTLPLNVLILVLILPVWYALVSWKGFIHYLGNHFNKNWNWKNWKGWSSGGKGICQGDSGGPLFYLNPSTNKYVLVGVSSFTSASGCGLTGPQKYVIFTCTRDGTLS